MYIVGLLVIEVLFKLEVRSLGFKFHGLGLMTYRVLLDSIPRLKALNFDIYILCLCFSYIFILCFLISYV